MSDFRDHLKLLPMCTHNGTLKSMENTNPRQFRSELKNYLDRANEKPIRIQRRDGDSFVLMSEMNYEELISEISSLQRRLLSTNDILSGNTKDLDLSNRKNLDRHRKK